MRRTKIVCTVGPASDDDRHLLGLVEHGMDVARLNMSHGSHEEHLRRLGALREYATKHQRVVATLFDLQGPKIRTGFLQGGEVHLKEGSVVTLTTERVQGSAELIPIDYARFPDLVQPGQQIFLSDGTLELKAHETSGKNVECKVVIGGELGNRKGVNLPGVEIGLPTLSEKDRKDAEFAVKAGADFIAISFVRNARDVVELRKLLEKHESAAQVVAKVENASAFHNLNEIIAAADAVMVARGDLGVQLPMEDIPLVQKTIVDKCNAAAKPVIVATQMLESMVHASQPTRAEVSDVANAILDGACALMLSAETAQGKHPVRALEVMDRIIRKTEASLMKYERMKDFDANSPLAIPQSVSKSVCYTARDLHANAVITYTHGGQTARFISMYRPFTPIIAATSDESVLRQLSVVWGVHPALIPAPKTTDDLVDKCVECAEKLQLVGKGDVVVIAATVPLRRKCCTNLMKVQVVGESVKE